jgi:hypothetical protein
MKNIKIIALLTLIFAIVFTVTTYFASFALAYLYHDLQPHNPVTGNPYANFVHGATGPSGKNYYGVVKVYYGSPQYLYDSTYQTLSSFSGSFTTTSKVTGPSYYSDTTTFTSHNHATFNTAGYSELNDSYSY